ncbi:MAG: polysaccharide deacetylase family protein [Anaerolineaceae bacterium]|nr:polysaccharide deacetylase family protein [Anaerolineaceae bacterium]
MRRGRLSRREWLRLGALALPGAALTAGQPILALDPAHRVSRPKVATGVAIRYINTGLRQVTLTFDDMYSEYHTLRIARACARRGIRATFFPTGIAAQNTLERSGDPDLYRRLRDMGHEFGTHLYTHRVLRELTYDELVWQEMNPALDVLRRSLGDDFVPVAMRPPYGIVTDAMKELSRQFNLPMVLWNLDSRDTLCVANPYKSALVCCSEMLAIMRKELTPGSIVLMHTIAPSSLAIDPVADLLARRNLKAVPLSQMLGSSA